MRRVTTRVAGWPPGRTSPKLRVLVLEVREEPTGCSRVMSGWTTPVPERAKEKGLSVGSFYPRILMPFPADKVIDFVKDARRVVVPEVNFTGQLARLIKAETNINELESVAKCDGLPFTAEAIIDLAAQEVAA